MDPLTILTGVASIGGGFMKGFMGGASAPGGPQISSAANYASMSAPFNVGGNAVESGSITGVAKSWGPLIIVAVGAWLIFRK